MQNERHKITVHGGALVTIQILIVEDDPELLHRFSAVITSAPDMSLIGAVPSGCAGLSLLATRCPDVALIDLGLPDMDGTELVRQVRQSCPHADVLVVTMFVDDRHVLRSIEAGASGYLLKDSSDQRLLDGIREVRAGGAPISPSIARKVLQQLSVAQAELRVVKPGVAAEPSPLTSREHDILSLIAKGLSFNEVAEQLDISVFTVVTHVKKIYRKLQVHSRGEAVFEARQSGWL
jgi:DNA-binding NarL/FixJ family response regulator